MLILGYTLLCQFVLLVEKPLSSIKPVLIAAALPDASASIAGVPTLLRAKTRSYDLALRRQALELYVDGMNFRAHRPASGNQPSQCHQLGQQGCRPRRKSARTRSRLKFWNSTSYTHSSDTHSPPKKEPAYVITCVEQDTRCILGFGVVWTRDWDAMQQVVDDALPAQRYFSDGFATYAQLLYLGMHTVAEGKSQTYSVEGGNAELRNYLARLGRLSRCFSRCI